MKLLFVIDHFGSGGAQRQMVNLALCLVRRGHTIEFFVYHSQLRLLRGPLDAENVKIHEHQEGFVSKSTRVLAVAALMRSGKFQGVLAFLETPSLVSELAHLLAPSVPIVVSERVDPLPRETRVRERLRCCFHVLAKRVVVNSETAYKSFSLMHPWMRSRLRLISNGVDLDYFQPLPAGIDADQREHVLVAVGTVNARKNVAGVIEALSLLKRRGDQVPRVMWVGKNEDTTTGIEYRKNMDRMLQEQSLDGSWIWVGEKNDVRPYLHAAGALIHPSVREGMSNAICEALACGCVVLASASGDNQWLVGRDERGLIFNPNDSTDIAEKISGFMAISNEHRAHMKRRARAFAEKYLGAEECAVQYERMFLELQ